MPAADLTEFVTASARAWSPQMADNVTLNNALLNRLMKKGKIKKVSSGRVIDEAIIYPTNANGSLKWYSGYDSFSPPTTSEVLDAAEFQWKQLGGFISISGIEKIWNSEPAKRYDYTEARLEQLEALMKNAVGLSCYSDGTGFGGKELGGLKLLIADDPTAAGTVGGINQQTFTFWQNKFSAAAATDATNIRGRMDDMWLQCTRGTDIPDLILADKTMYSLYWSSLQALERYTQHDTANSGFSTLAFVNADVIYDVNCPTKHMYFVNSDTLKLKCSPDRIFDVGKPRTIQNADYDVIPVFFAGNFTVNNRSLNGVVIAS
jgi:hypothetical protein